LSYVEFPSDAAFTLWLALLKPKQVSGEAHTRLNVSERRMVAYSRRQNPIEAKRLVKNKKTSALGTQSVTATRQMFTAEQVAIAQRVLEAQENRQKRESA